ncbi:hypothetical protein ABTK20_22115, partial [Acinetobacter baumannii]
ARDEMPHAHEQIHAATPILHHSHMVDRIFMANLQRQPHGFLTTSPDTSPALEALFHAVRETDRWYIDYASVIQPTDLAEMIA